MKQPISNKHSAILQAIILSIGAVFLVVFSVIFFQIPLHAGERFAAAVTILLSVANCYYFIGFYRVSFDDDSIYLSRLRSTEKVALQNVESVMPAVFPIRFFFRNVYVVKVVYLENGRKRKIRFLSKGAEGFVGTVDNIPLLDSLRQKVYSKKNPAVF